MRAGVLVLLLGATPAQPVAEPVRAEYRVAPGDVLDVTLHAAPEVSRTPVVGTDGTIFLPFLGDVPVADKTPAEIAQALVALLQRESPASPSLSVRVLEFRGQFFWVEGEVEKPGRLALSQGMRVADALAAAGGLTPRASGLVVLSRAGDQGSVPTPVRTARLVASSVGPQERALLEAPLFDRDVVTAIIQGYVTIEGEVKKPGRYPVDETTTLGDVVSRAGALTRFGSPKLAIRRLDPTSGLATVLEVDWDAIRRQRAEDPRLQAGDLVEARARRF